MKKLLFVALITLVGFANVNAQEKGDFEIGGGLGLNISNVSTIDGGDNTSSKLSFNIGASGEYYLSQRWGIKAKLIFDSKGWADGFVEQGTPSGSFTTITTDFKLNYLTIPIMANWHFGSNRNWYLNFGPYIGVLLNAEDSELGLDLKDGFKTTDFGIALGIGYKFEVADNLKLVFEYDVQSGLTDIFEVNAGETIRNGRSALNVGVLFNL
jgi:opacity protein-like surface antigen